MHRAGHAAAQSLQAIHLSYKIIPLFTSLVSSQRMLSPESWREWSFFIWICDSPFWLKGIKEGTEEDRIVVLRTNPLNVGESTLL